MESSSIPLEQRHPEFRWLVRRFELNIDVLRDMLTDMGPTLREMDEKRLGPDALATLSALSSEEQERLRDVLKRISAQGRAELERRRAAGDESYGPVEAGAEEDVKELNSIIGGDRHVLGQFIQRTQDLAAGPRRVTIFHNSLLAMAIGAFEVLVAGLMVRFFIQHPSSLDDQQKHFTLEDLRRFDDLDDAADQLITAEVANLMRGGLDDWSKWFLTRGKIEFPELAMNYEAVREAFQRRHIVIHNGGIVSSQYVAKVVHADDPPAVGKHLTNDPDYLNQVLDQLDVLGTALGCIAWAKWEKDERDEAANELLKRSYDLMLLTRWESVRALAGLAGTLSAAEMLTRSLQCNCWLAEFELTGPESIREEVLEWDTSAMTGRFRLVRLVLLGENEAACALLPDLLSSEEISWGELREWPILRPLRESSDFGMVSKELAPGKELGESTD